MLSRTHKTTLLAAAALAGAMVAQAAGAAMIEQWDYTIDTGFANIDSLSSTTTASDKNAKGDPTKISAYDGHSTSWIGIDGSVTGSGLTTNGSSVDGATFTHNNQVLEKGTDTLHSFAIDTYLGLTATAPPDENGQKANQFLKFQSHFIETSNTVGEANCPAPGGDPCSDIFVLDNADVLGSPNADGDFVISQDFHAGSDNRLYTLFLTIEDFMQLSDDACAAADAGTECIGLITNEGTENNFKTHLRIVSAVSVPEPGTLAIMLMGLGLLGLGFAVRRRNGGHQLSV